MARHDNPSRRNRNIGTSKQGHGADNEQVIPSSLRDSLVYWERLNDPREFEFEVYGERRIALVEAPRAGEVYGCTVDDLMHLLRCLPERDTECLKLFLFRQSTRKQQSLASVWGRFMYFATPGHYQGSGIGFEALSDEVLHWSKSVDPETEREFERLRGDGHEVVLTKRHWEIRMTPTSVRNTVLYRTALHEVGHFVDWVRSVIDIADDQERERASRTFDSKPSAMKEDFAHRYASETGAELRADGVLPFEPRWDERAMTDAGIERAWFL